MASQYVAWFMVGRLLRVLSRRISEHVERELVLLNPGILGSSATSVRFDFYKCHPGAHPCICYCVMHVKNQANCTVMRYTVLQSIPHNVIPTSPNPGIVLHWLISQLRRIFEMPLNIPAKNVIFLFYFGSGRAGIPNFAKDNISLQRGVYVAKFL